MNLHSLAGVYVHDTSCYWPQTARCRSNSGWVTNQLWQDVRRHFTKNQTRPPSHIQASPAHLKPHHQPPFTITINSQDACVFKKLEVRSCFKDSATSWWWPFQIQTDRHQMFPRCNVKQSTFTKSLQPTWARAAESGHKTLNLICCSSSWRRGFSLLAPALLTLMAGEHSSATVRMVALKTRCVTTHSHSGYMSAFNNQTVAAVSLSQTVTVWRQVASRQVTCAVTVWLKAFTRRLNLPQRLGEQLVAVTTCSQSPAEKMTTDRPPIVPSRAVQRDRTINLLKRKFTLTTAKRDNRCHKHIISCWIWTAVQGRFQTCNFGLAQTEKSRRSNEPDYRKEFRVDE